MTEFLNVGAIRSAADLLNSTLVSKGFVNHELLFPTIDWSTLIQDQPEKAALTKLETRESIYNNDKNVINLLYSLTQSLDRHTAQQRALNMALEKKEKTIEQLRQKVSLLELRAQSSENRLNRTVRVDQVALEERNKQLSRQNRAQLQEITRLRNWNTDLLAKYDVELRKKTFEISQLKDKLLDTRNLSTTITYGKPMKLGREPAGRTPIVSPHLIYDNKPVLNVDTQLRLEPDTALRDVVREEYDEIAAQLSELLESLIRENGKYVSFCNALANYFALLNAELADSIAAGLLRDQIPNPKNYIDLKKIGEKLVDEVEPFETVSGPLLSKANENYQCLLELVAIIRNTNGKGQYIDSDPNNDILKRLQDENKGLRDNLSEAMNAIDGYKNYKLRRET